MSDAFLSYQTEDTVPEENTEQKKLAITTQRTCECPPNNLNCLTPKEWMKSQLGVVNVSKKCCQMLTNGYAYAIL